MIKKIKIIKEYRTIPDNFELELEQMTVITGENNSGKTNFINIIDRETKIKEAQNCTVFYDSDDRDITKNVRTIYIPAESIMGDEEFKISKTNTLIQSLKDLIGGSPNFILGKDDEKNHINNLKSVFDSANKKISEIFDYGEENQSIKLSISESLTLKEVFEIALEISPADCTTGIPHEKFNQLGQGWQRLIIISFILAIAERNSDKNNQTLVLLEEPEAYLHPKLKKALNKMLNDIVLKGNYQVIITTHDPYFAFINSDNENSNIFSFFKNGKYTDKEKGVIFGVEDELLHIFLFNKFLRNSKVKNLSMGPRGSCNDYLKKQGDMIIKKYFWPNDDEEDMAIPLYIRHQIHHPNNKNTLAGKNSFNDNDLRESIKILNKIIN